MTVELIALDEPTLEAHLLEAERRNLPIATMDR